MKLEYRIVTTKNWQGVAVFSLYQVTRQGPNNEYTTVNYCLAEAASIPELRERYQAMADAFNKPVMEWQPAKLVPM